MKRPIFFSCAISILMTFQPSLCAQFESLRPNFNRAVSRVMIRKIPCPTMANLDYAAYIANPIRFDPDTFFPKAPAKKIKPADCSFGGLLSRQCGTMAETPLTPEEQNSAMAWEPLQKKLWQLLKTNGFAKIGAAINSTKWADPSVYAPYQEATAAYLHGSGDGAQMWIKIEFKPWVTFVEGMSDEGKDGFKALYGKLNLDAIDKKTVENAFAWIRSDYGKRVLTRDEANDWAVILASYWYPKLNTDIEDMTGQQQWPNENTEEGIVKEMKGLTITKPFVVIHGNPQGVMLYNVFVADFPLGKTDTTVFTARDAAPRMEKTDTAASRNFIDNNDRFSRESTRNGDYGTWALKTAEFRKEVTDIVKALPPTQMGFKGKDDWVFFRKDIDVVNAGDLNAQPADKNPIPHLKEFKKFLEKKNISLLFAVVPDKSEVYFEKLPGRAPADAEAVINPYERKFLKDAQDAGIEVIDLLPLFLAAKKDDAKNKEGIYQKQDTHWTDRGLEIAAEAIAGRIRQYGWYGRAAESAVLYSVKDTIFIRQGDIVDKLSESDRAAYPPVTLAAKQVFTPDGARFKPNNPQAPIVLIGDSFTGVFEIVDCKGAGVGAHIAKKTGLPVDIITSWGGGPQVREKFLRARMKSLPGKRVVVYLMVERDLYNYGGGWAPLEVK